MALCRPFLAFGEINRLRKNSDSRRKPARDILQGLKPTIFCSIYGTTKVVPFQCNEFFRNL
jgi:hypothetical protein